MTAGCTPIDLGRLVAPRHLGRRVGYELRELSTPGLEALLEPVLVTAPT